MLFSILFALYVFNIVVAQDDDHGHDDHGDEGGLVPCECEAKELGFTINCESSGAEAALEALEANSCAADKCKTDDVCKKNYFILQAHHDHCLAGSIPSNVVEELHEFEGHCTDCFIKKMNDPSLAECPAATCDDSGAAVSAANSYLTDNSCATNCTATCGTNFKTLRSYHDTCGANVVTEAIERALHDFETPCAAYDCQVKDHEEEGHEGHDSLDCSKYEHADSSASILSFSSMLVLIFLGSLL